MPWVSIKLRKPKKSGHYNVRVNGVYKYIDSAYYDKHTDAWIYDDGDYLPFDIRASITHWKDQSYAKWVQSDIFTDKLKCTCCGCHRQIKPTDITWGEWKYCPNCGTEMR